MKFSLMIIVYIAMREMRRCGVLLAVHNTISIRFIYSSSDLEVVYIYIYIAISLHNMNLTLFVVYFPPSIYSLAFHNFNHFLKNLFY